MRTRIATATTPGRWRRRRAARIALATALIVAAPFVGSRDADGSGSTGSGSGHARSTEATAPGGTGAENTWAVGAEAHSADQPRTHSGEAVRLVPVPLADAGVADVLASGDLVDLIAVGTAPDQPPGHAPVVVAHSARVRETPDGRGGTRSILVEVPESAAAPLAAIAAGTPLAVIVHG